MVIWEDRPRIGRLIAEDVIPAAGSDRMRGGLDGFRRHGERPDPGHREGRRGLQGRVGRRRRARPVEQGLEIDRGLEHLAEEPCRSRWGNTRNMAKKKTPAGADQPRPSKALLALREALGLDEEGWQAYLGTRATASLTSSRPIS
jgi:hypothetical protein